MDQPKNLIFMVALSLFQITEFLYSAKQQTRNFNLDSWIRVVDRLKDFSIKLTANSRVHNFIAASDAHQIEINISDVDISEGYKIDII
jgi:hypothetical protein